MREIVIDYNAQPVVNWALYDTDEVTYTLNSPDGVKAIDYSQLSTRNALVTKFTSGVAYQYAVVARIPPAVGLGQTFTVTAWVNTPASIIRVARRQGNSTNPYESFPQAITPNTWTKVVWTIPVDNISMDSAQIDIGNEAGDLTGSGMVWYLHSVMVTLGTTVYDDYFDSYSLGVKLSATSENLGTLNPTVFYPGQFRNKLQQRISTGPDADGLWSYGSNGPNKAVFNEVTDPIPGTAVTRVIDVNIPADATRTYSTVTASHNLFIKKGEVWTVSYWVKGISADNPAYTLTLMLIKSNATNPIYRGGPTVNPTSSWKRVVDVFTATDDAEFYWTDNASNNRLYFLTSDADKTLAAHYRIGGISLERGDKRNGPFSPSYYPDANGGPWTAFVYQQVFDGGAYNDTIYDGPHLDGGGVIQYA